MPKSMTRSTITNNVWYKSMLVGNEPTLPVAYELIATTTLTGNLASVTFSAIPQTYKHLQIRAVIRSFESTTASRLGCRVNGTTSASYANHQFYNSGSIYSEGYSAVATALNTRYPGTSNSSNYFASVIIDINDYTDTTKNKTIRALSGYRTSQQTFIEVQSGFLPSLSAINSLTFFNYNSPTTSFVANTRFSLYGIKG